MRLSRQRAEDGLREKVSRAERTLAQRWESSAGFALLCRQSSGETASLGRGTQLGSVTRRAINYNIMMRLLPFSIPDEQGTIQERGC